MVESFSTSFSLCKECGFSHPPVVDGPCPMAPIKTAAGQSVTNTALEKFLSNFRVKLKMELERTKIKNVNNFFIHITNQLDDAIKNYKE
jgi:hypothetical protein